MYKTRKIENNGKNIIAKNTRLMPSLRKTYNH